MPIFRPTPSPALALAGLLTFAVPIATADERLAGIACRSVHLGYPAPEGTTFTTELTVESSAPGSYFMACGFDGGYFGIQEQDEGKKVVIFSVWDPGDQDDPKSVKSEDRVLLRHKDPAVRVGRFGGEGTGGQSFLDFDWKLGQPYRFLVRAQAETGEDGRPARTRFSGYFLDPEHPGWRHLVSFSTRSAKPGLRGYYSFIEDFRRDRVSLTHARAARFGSGWVQSVEGRWVALTRAKFTGDANPATNIDAAVSGDTFRLATGGATRNDGARLNGSIDRPPAGFPLP